MNSVISAILIVFPIAIRLAVSTELVPNLASLESGKSVRNDVNLSALLTKMEYLEYKLLEMDFEIKDQNQRVLRNQDQLEKTHAGMTWMMNRFEQAVGDNFTSLLEQSWRLLQLQRSCVSYEVIRDEVFKLKPVQDPSDDITRLLDMHPFKQKGPFESCKVEPSKTSGNYMLKPVDCAEPFIGNCEQTKFGGGWLVIQHRYDGTVDFYRNWFDYKVGFGKVGKEFWIGLELLHRITTAKAYQLLVEMEDYNGDYRYAKYTTFEIGNETEKYSLKKLGTYTGTAGDSLVYHKGMKFSTFDSDNDANSGNCALDNGAWWYNSCSHSNLNGKFMNADDTKAVTWYHFKNKHAGLRYTRMMIREA